MLKVVLISANGQEYETGARTIASCLRDAGHDTYFLYPVPGKANSLPRMTEEDAEQLDAICCDADLIGITYLSNFRGNARKISERLTQIKKKNCMVVAGGVHPMVWAEDALEDFQYLLRGEGEQTMVELARRLEVGEDFLDLPGLAYRKDDEIIKNPVPPVIQDVNDLPIPFLDYGKTFFRNVAGGLVALTEQNAREFFWKSDNVQVGEVLYNYGIHSIRGCPLQCNFCINDALIQVYTNNKSRRLPVRKQSPDRLVKELLWVKKTFPFVGLVLFTDDIFTARPIDELAKITVKYKDEVGLPFECYLSAPTIDDKKLNMLIDCGLASLSMGIQSGSDRMNLEVYDRPIKRKQNEAAVAVIAKRFDELDPVTPLRVHYIVKSPWEKKADVVQTVDMIAHLPCEVFVILFSLCYFPGTKITEWAMEQGVIKDIEMDIEDFDGWADKDFLFNRETGRPDPAGILPLLAVQQLRFIPGLQKKLLLALLNSNLGYKLVGTWKFYKAIMKAVTKIADMNRWWQSLGSSQDVPRRAELAGGSQAQL